MWGTHFQNNAPIFPGFARQPRRQYKRGACDVAGRAHKRGCGCTVYINGRAIEHGTNVMRPAEVWMP